MEDQYIPIQEKLNMRGLKQIFIGFVLICLTFRINRFDILPDFLGYIFIANGLNDLSKTNKRYSKAIPFAVILIILSLFNFYQIPIELDQTNPYVIGVFKIIDSIIMFLLLSIIYIICTTTSKIAVKYNEDNLAKKYDLCWHLNLILSLAAFLLNNVLFFLDVNFLLLTIIVLLTNLVARIFFIVLLVQGYILNGKYITYDFEEINTTFPM